MRASMSPGLEYSLTETVTADLSPPHLAPVVVLSTPSMIRLMEEASLQCVAPHLDANETTVGTHVNVSHSDAARDGETVLVLSQLISIEKRRLTFAVVVSTGDRVIGQGTHERAIISLDRLS